MMTCVRTAVLGGLLLALAAGPAFGNGWRGRSASYPYPASYAPVAPYAIYQPVAPAPLVCVPAAPRPAALVVELPAYAQPRAAGPSQPIIPRKQTAEPPLLKPKARAPEVGDWRPGPSEAKGDAGKTAPERFPVGFWNVSGRDVMLTVGGQTRLLPRNRSVTLELGRAFTWQVDQQPPRQGSVPAGRTAAEIVIR